jgi:predicted transcriptional regulator
MTKLLEEAFDAVRRLPPDDQDEIARAIFRFVEAYLAEPVPLSPEEREAIERSQAAAARGEFATDEEIQAIWAKYGL